MAMCLWSGGRAFETNVATGGDQSIMSRAALNAAVLAGPNRKVGFLSEANYLSVHTVLGSGVEPMYFSDTDDLYAAVEDETVIAALISGVPDASRFTVFSTDLISPRAFQMMPGTQSRDLMEAVDAAVVRTHNAGELQKAEAANPPFQAVEVHTCRTDDPSKIPFPAAADATGLLKDVLDNKKLRVLAYGSPDALPDWKQDGNYQVTPMTGFWPDYMDYFMAQFRGAYGSDIQLERVWMTAGGTDKILDGSIHMTEPYYIYENLFNDRVKKWSHTFSCVVVGYEQNFFAKQKGVTTIVSDGQDTCAVALQNCTNQRVASAITSRGKLNTAISDGDNKKMGFLSEANYMSMHTVLSDKVQPVYYTSTDELYAAVDSEEIVAALISGTPDAERYNIFSTDLISPRAFQMMPGDSSKDLMEAIDAAVVRTHNAGELLLAQDANPPFEAIEVHTCRTDDPTKIPFPAAATATGLLKDVLDNKKLKMLSYGTADDLPDWAQDGIYSTTPATGFWPDYMNYWMAHFQQAYGSDIVLERVWMTAGGSDMLLNGSIHMSAPYYIYENLYNDRLKKWSHEFSCVVMGYEQQFFSKKAVLDFSDAGATCDDQLLACTRKDVTLSSAPTLKHSLFALLLMLYPALS